MSYKDTDIWWPFKDMNKLPAILVNYNFSPTWLKDYPELEVTIYDRSDDGVERDLTQYGAVIRTPNVGNVDYDKLTYLVENYYDLPDVFLWGKTNLFKYVEPEQLREALEKREYTPLCKNHPTTEDQFGRIGYSDGGLYYERAVVIVTGKHT